MAKVVVVTDLAGDFRTITGEAEKVRLTDWGVRVDDLIQPDSTVLIPWAKIQFVQTVYG